MVMHFAVESAKAGNDDFAKRVIVEGIRPVMVGTLLEATLEKDELLPAGMNNASASVWYQWTSPVNGRVTIQELAEEFGNLGTGDVGFYKGDKLSSLIEVRPDLPARTLWPLVFAVEMGVTYQIQIIGAPAIVVNAFRFHLRATQVPNDSFVSSQHLVENLGSISNLTLLNSSIEIGEPGANHEDVAPNHSAWFRYDSEKVGKLKINVNGLVGGAFHPKPEVRFYTGDTLNSLTNIQSDFTYLPICDIQPFTTYYIQLFNRGPIYLASSFDDPAFLFEGAFDLDWKLFTAPAHNNFINAKDITLASNALSGSLPHETTLAATHEPDEQQHSYNVLVDKTSQGSIWYKWTAPKTGLFAFRATLASHPSHNILVNALIGIYQGDTIETLIKEAPVIIINQSTGATTGTIANAIVLSSSSSRSSSSASSLPSQPTLLTEILKGDGKYGCVELKATEGTEYYIAVDSIDHQLPDFLFKWNYFEKKGSSSSSSNSSSSTSVSGEGCTSSQP